MTDAVADAVVRSYCDYAARFAAITARASSRFAARDWASLQADATERLDLYSECVDAAVAEIRTTLGDQITVTSHWAAARDSYAEFALTRPDAEVTATFFNSITRRIFDTVGVDPAIEFVEPVVPHASSPATVRRYDRADSAAVLFEQVLLESGFAAPWQNIRRDAQLAVAEIDRALVLHGVTSRIDWLEVLGPVFYRGQGAYLVGRLQAGSFGLPLAVAIHRTTRGLTIGAVLLEADDISVLFSYTRSSFHVATDRPGELVAYLQELMPLKRRAELYSSLGFHKHGKTELYRDFMAHVEDSNERFEHARGIRGMVMIVFTMPGYDVVFKVIRDRFPFPKQTTPRQIRAKYRLVFRHDRAGRLIDAQEFEHLRFGRGRFTDELLAELESDGTRSATVDEHTVTLHHVYVERRVTPLDLYVREANPIKAQSAIVDYGRAIKNLAATNIFPGDMLLKNFGVTRSGRVVFYDYDEITALTECKFREMPDTDRPDLEMSADPWFGVGDNDIFPEEFDRFLGIRGELREVFDYHHGDLLGVRFWRRIQDRVRSGEMIEIFPYRRSRRLGTALRGLAGRTA